MRITQTLCWIMATILIAMMVCPAIAAAQVSQPQKMDHCSSEKPAPQQKQVMLCCCDQSATPVVQVHAPYQVAVANLDLNHAADAIDFVFAPHSNYLPYQRTGDHLSLLCVLRF